MSSNARGAFTPATIKSIFRPYFSDHKSSHLSEALARACGYDTHAAYITDLDNDAIELIFVNGIDTKQFANRLSELSGINTEVAAIEMAKAIKALHPNHNHPAIPLGPRTALRRQQSLQSPQAFGDAYGHIFASPGEVSPNGEQNPRVLVVMFPEEVSSDGKADRLDGAIPDYGFEDVADFDLTPRTLTEGEVAKLKMVAEIMEVVSPDTAVRPFGLEGVASREDGIGVPFTVVVDDDGFRYQDYDDIRRLSRPAR